MVKKEEPNAWLLRWRTSRERSWRPRLCNLTGVEGGREGESCVGQVPVRGKCGESWRCREERKVWCSDREEWKVDEREMMGTNRTNPGLVWCRWQKKTVQQSN